MSGKPYKTKDENIKDLFYSIKGRVGRIGLYKNRKLLIDWADFYEFLITDKEYNRIYRDWSESNFDSYMSPSIDRIDNLGDYILDNIQVLTKVQNIRKGQGDSFYKENIVSKLHLVDKRNELIMLLKSQGCSNSVISNIFNIHRSTVKRINDKYIKLNQDERYKKLARDLKD